MNDERNIFENEYAIIKNIELESKTIDAYKISCEVIQWLSDNVVNFIDNHSKNFKIDLVISDPEDVAELSMPETFRLQKLYRSLPEDPVAEDNAESIDGAFAKLSKEHIGLMEETYRCKNSLDNITSKVFENMRDHKLLGGLFEKMVFFYEVRGISNGNFIKQNLVGSVAITSFTYDNFRVNVKVTEKNKDAKDGKVIKDVVIPEGFAVWLEISFKSKAKAFSLF